MEEALAAGLAKRYFREIDRLAGEYIEKMPSEFAILKTIKNLSRHQKAFEYFVVEKRRFLIICNHGDGEGARRKFRLVEFDVEKMRQFKDWEETSVHGNASGYDVRRGSSFGGVCPFSVGAHAVKRLIQRSGLFWEWGLYQNDFSPQKITSQFWHVPALSELFLLADRACDGRFRRSRHVLIPASSGAFFGQIVDSDEFPEGKVEIRTFCSENMLRVDQARLRLKLIEFCERPGVGEFSYFRFRRQPRDEAAIVETFVNIFD